MAKKKKKKVIKKGRAPNRYNTFRSYASKYCANTYGAPCSNQKMNKIYRQLKAEFYDQKLPLPEDKLNQIIGSHMKQYDKGLPPSASQSFPWWEVQSTLLNYKDAYFKPDDIMVFDLSDLGFSDMTVAPFDEILETVAFELRSRIDALRKEDADIESPVPYFDMVDLDIKGTPRKFKYKLALGSAAASEYNVLPDLSTDPFGAKKPSIPPIPPEEKAPEKKKEAPSKTPSSASEKQLETKRIEAETKLVQEQTRLASLQLEKANKALELIGKGFSMDQVNKLLGI